MSVPEPLIHARGLVKRFDQLTAVDGIDFEVARGETFGFLGPNGAGKSSTMRMIGCVSPVSEGVLRVLGRDPAAAGGPVHDTPLPWVAGRGAEQPFAERRRLGRVPGAQERLHRQRRVRGGG